MVTHLLHGLWLRESGLHFWIEQVEGHRVVTPDEVPQGTFPPWVDAQLREKQFRHWVRVQLQTPSGKFVELRIPTASLSPEQAVQVFGQLAVLDGVSPAASKSQRDTIAPDLRWLVRMYRGLERYVRAGRVALRVRWVDGEWWPQWQLAEGRGERGWLAAMTSALPGVLASNCGVAVAEDIAEELPHWIASAILQELVDAPRPAPWHEFSHALLNNAPLRNGSARLVHALNVWKDSAANIPAELVVVVEQAARDDTLDTEFWPVRIRVRFGVGSPVPVRTDSIDTDVLLPLRQKYEDLCEIAATLGGSVAQAPARGERAERVLTLLGEERSGTVGDWDAYLTTDELQGFLAEDVARLRASGFSVMLPKSWSRYELKATLDIAPVTDPAVASTQVKVGFEQVVGFQWRLSLGGEELTEAEMKQLIASKAGLVRLRGEWVIANAESLRKVTHYVDQLAETSKRRRDAELQELYAQLRRARAAETAEVSELERRVAELEAAIEHEHDGLGEVTIAELRELALAHAESQPVDYVGSTWHLALAGELEDSSAVPAPTRVKIPSGVRAELREYQRRGVDWLLWMSGQNLGAVLADDMGLGKTLQLLTLLAVERECGSTAPTLIVAPTSVLNNWAAEAARFTPDARVMIHYGTQRASGDEFCARARKADLVITSYGILSREFLLLQRVEWEHVVLDEAQQIKNSSTKVARAARSLPARQRMALTGTPIENRLSELRSILDFCNPGILGSASFFRNHFAKAIEREEDEVMAERLQRLTAPFILRRLKTDPAIIDDLPEKNEEIVHVNLTSEQAALYKALVDNVEEQIERTAGVSRKGLILATITRIKQICNHPAHYLGDDSPLVLRGRHRSGKVQELIRILDEAAERQERVLVFTQYRAFGKLLQGYLAERLDTQVPFLHGGVSKARRDAMIAEFQGASGPPVMLLSLKAGGTGLNLTGANVVVHMDRWWNPAVENQATDRAYRIGQDKNVRVYKMIATGTLEESIQDVLDGKLRLAEAVIRQGEGWITELSPDQLMQLMSYRGKEDAK